MHDASFIEYILDTEILDYAVWYNILSVNESEFELFVIPMSSNSKHTNFDLMIKVLMQLTSGAVEDKYKDHDERI